MGRLRPDVSTTAAPDTLRATNARLFPIWRSSFQNEKATWGLQDLKARVVGDVGSTLVFVLAAVACVLLIACANAVNLLIARSLHRSRELAIRGALGASTGRLLQHVMVEASLLTAGAALVGLGVAAVALRLIAVYGGDYVPRIDEVRLLDDRLAWLAGLALASGIVIGIVPACTARGCASTRRCAPADARPPTRRRRGACSARSSPPSSRWPRRSSSPARWSSPASIG